MINTVQHSLLFLDLLQLPSLMSWLILWWLRELEVNRRVHLDLSSHYVGDPQPLEELFVFGVTALLPLLTSTVAVLVNEERLPLGERSVSLSVSSSELIDRSKQRIMQIWNSVKQPSIFLPTLFIFLWQATPQSDSAMFFFTLGVSK
jgi:hypothetical protein